MQHTTQEMMCKPTEGGFVAGTQVHTRNGLKPIREIQVGDWVLSRSEDPAHGGGNGYKRVTRVIGFEKKVVNFV